MKLLYGTGNIAKLHAMQHRLAELNVEVIGLKDLHATVPEVEENGLTPLENAEKKAAVYFDTFHIPVFSCDSGLYIDELPDNLQPATHVRRINGKNLTDTEMIAYYSSLARQYGRLTARYKNAVCFVKDHTHIYKAMTPSMESGTFYIVEKPHTTVKKGFPIDTLSVDVRTGKYFYDLPPQQLEQLAVEDGFLEFFRKYL